MAWPLTQACEWASMQGILSCLAFYLRFLVPAVVVLLLVYRYAHLPHEVFRKLLHMVAFFSAPLIMHAADGWLTAVATLFLFGAAVWPLLALGERLPHYADIFVQRRTHEVRRSMLLLFWGDAALVGWCWGLCARPQQAVAAILMWGFGDATAALVGKRFGRHHVYLPLVDHKKTWEGSAAMCAVEVLVGSLVLGPSPVVLLAAAVGAYVELATHAGYDTVTVPFALACVLLLLG